MPSADEAATILQAAARRRAAVWRYRSPVYRTALRAGFRHVKTAHASVGPARSHDASGKR